MTQPTSRSVEQAKEVAYRLAQCKVCNGDFYSTHAINEIARAIDRRASEVVREMVGAVPKVAITEQQKADESNLGVAIRWTFETQNKVRTALLAKAKSMGVKVDTPNLT